MKIVTPRNPPSGAVRVKIAENQPQYIPMEVNIFPLIQEKPIESEWEFTPEEIQIIVMGGRIRMTMLSFGEPVNPVKLEVIPGVEQDVSIN